MPKLRKSPTSIADLLEQKKPKSKTKDMAWLSAAYKKLDREHRDSVKTLNYLLRLTAKRFTTHGVQRHLLKSALLTLDQALSRYPSLRKEVQFTKARVR